MAENKEKPDGMLMEIVAMMKSSVGRIPATLVIIFAVAVTVALLTGLFIQIAINNKAPEGFLPLRLETSADVTALTANQLQGTWVTQTPTYAMTFSFIGDRFEWIVSLADTKEVLFYARGNYSINSDVMVLGQRPDLGIPFDTQKPWIKNIPMAMKNLNVRIALQDKKLIWTIPASEQARVLSHTAQIFEENKDGIFTWIKR